MNHTDISSLAEQAGIATEWADAHGLPQHVSPTVLAAMLDALGFPCGGNVQYRDSKARLEAQDGRTTLSPLLTAQVGHPIKIPHPSHASLHGQFYCIELESGEIYQGRFSANNGSPLCLPPINVSGYHRFFVRDQSIILAVAPTRCFGIADVVVDNMDSEKPANGSAYLWGLAVQLYSLRRQGDGGLGDYTTLEQLVCGAAREGASAIAISPVHAMFSADPSRYSPYGPSSRLFLNAMHIDPAAVFVGRANANTSATENKSDAITAELHSRLEHLSLIDWPAAAGSRLALLRMAYTQFLESGPNSAFEEFCQQGGRSLQDHACYEALQEWLPSQVADTAKASCGDWRRWPHAYRDPRSLAVAEFAQQHVEQIGFHLFLQWQAGRGLIGAQSAARAAGMRIGLIADLAIGADRGGSQAWSEQGEMLNGLSVGAPPDLLNVAGQNWGLGAYSPWALQASGFGPFIAMLRACFAHSGGARIDHVLGLARLWLVPEGASATDGAYLRYPLEDMLRLIALESWRYRAIVIGENLGTVPPGFDARLAEINLLGIDVLWFQRDGLGFMLPMSWSENTIATTTTHDLPTVAGWWSGTDIGWRTKLGLLEVGRSDADETALREQERQEFWKTAIENGCAQGVMPESLIEAAPIAAALALVGATPAPLVLIPMEDILGLAEQPNLPGTTESGDNANNPGSHPNWRRRLPANVENLFSTATVQAVLSSLKRGRVSAIQDATNARNQITAAVALSSTPVDKDSS